MLFITVYMLKNCFEKTCLFLFFFGIVFLQMLTTSLAIIPSMRKYSSHFTSNLRRISFPVNNFNRFFSLSSIQGIDTSIPTINKPISEKLVNYLQEYFTDKLLEINNDQDTSIKASKQLISQILSKTQDNKEISTIGGTIIAELTYYSNKTTGQKFPYDLNKINIDELIQNLENRTNNNKKVFNTIVSHHENISQKDWIANVNNVDALKNYCIAASNMGKRNWVKESNDWMGNYIYSFFRNSLARKTFYKTHLKNVASPYYGYSIKDLSCDIMAQLSRSSSTIRKIKILDVGACYNPLQSSEHAESFDITAIDLYPGDKSVYKCDFLALKVGPLNSAPIIEIDKDGVHNIVQLPEASFDVVTMSLVLNYLPTPDLREQMIVKARQLLVNPVNEGIIHYSGLLLIIEKKSCLNHDRFVTPIHPLPNSKNAFADSWKGFISNSGFELAKYNQLNAATGQISHAFAFTTKAMSNQNSNENPYRMWIRTDFYSKTISEQPQTNCSNSAKSNNFFISSTISPMNLPIGIVGGGLAGSALALALHRLDIPSILFEKDESFNYRRQGYALTMQQGGVALKELGLTQDIIEFGTISLSHHSYDWKGNSIGAYGAHLTAKRTHTAEPEREDESFYEGSTIRTRHNVHIPRQKLRELMISKIPGESIQWNKKFSGMELISSSPSDDVISPINLKFQDNSEYQVAMVIGADGIFSNVRNFLENTSKSPLVYLNLMVILGISPISSTLDGKDCLSRQWVNGHTRVFSMPFNKDSCMWQMSYPLTENEAKSLSSYNIRGQHEISHVGKALKFEALNRIKDWDPTLVRILEKTDDDLVSGHPVYDRNPDDILTFRNPEEPLHRQVSLLGDAAHPMSPFKGQGANQALLDAVHLAHAIDRADKYSKADLFRYIEAYEKEMQVRNEAKVLASRDAALFLHSPSALAVGNITRARAAELNLLENQTK